MLCSHFVTDDVPKAFLYAMVYITMATQALFVNSDTPFSSKMGKTKYFRKFPILTLPMLR